LARLELEEHPVQPSITNEEIELLSEERAFAWVKQTYTPSDILSRAKLLLAQNHDAYQFLSEAIDKLYRNQPLSLLMKNHLITYFKYMNIEFYGIFLKEFKKLKEENNASLIQLFQRLPMTKIVFMDLLKDMKQNPSLLESFFNDPLIQLYNIKNDLLEQMKN
jgi:hypothetical protein